MATFFDLPLEVREQIYRSALPRQQLKAKAQKILDPAWTDAAKPEGIPSLFFVNKTIAEEAPPIFYSNAVLNIAPAHVSHHFFGISRLQFANRLDLQFASCLPAHLQRIRTAKIFSAQSDAVNAEAYESLLRWLVDNTAVQDIFLSFRLMTRIRRARADINATSSLCQAAPNLSLIRTVHVYGFDLRSMWELTRISEITSVLRPRGEQLPELQAYVVETGGQYDALLDPRWDLRKSSTTEDIHALRETSKWIDGLLEADKVTQQPPWERLRPGLLYQVCFVFGADSDKKPSKPDS